MKTLEKADLLLIQPRMGVHSPFHPGYLPLRLAYVAAVARKKGIGVKILDMNALQMDKDELPDFLEVSQPNVVGISCFADSYVLACEVAKKAKEFGCLTIMSGPHVASIAYELLNDNPFVDVVLRGEEEQVMTEIMEASTGKKEFTKIEGITYRERGVIHTNPDREMIANIDELPFPTRELLPIKQHEYTSILATRGCPFRCIYCPFPVFWRHTFRMRSPENVLDEVEILFKEHGVARFEFLDSVFVFRGWGERLFQLLQQYRMDTKWVCSTRVDFVSEESLGKAAEVGCSRITFGVETCSDRTLQKINKNIRMDQVRNAGRWAKKYGIETKLNFVFGLPFQTREEMLACPQLIEELRPSEVTLSILTPYPGAEVVEKPQEYGVTFRGRDWWKYKPNSRIPQVSTRQLPFKEISALFSLAESRVRELGIAQSDSY